jgi:hypothetical protein
MIYEGKDRQAVSSVQTDDHYANREALILGFAMVSSLKVSASLYTYLYAYSR